MECYLDTWTHYILYATYIITYEEIDKMIDTAFDGNLKGAIVE